jgi:phosphoglycerate dehydrogenase-like enzyme
MSVFRVGITPDFYEDAKGHFEAVLAAKLSVPGIEYSAMPPQPGNVATPETLESFDAIFALALRFTPASLRGVERLALVARWGVGYDMIDVPALTASGVALAITPEAVKRPVAEAILTFIFALSKDLCEQDRIAFGEMAWQPTPSRGDGGRPGAGIRRVRQHCTRAVPPRQAAGLRATSGLRSVRRQ